MIHGLRTMSLPNPEAFYQAVDLLELNNTSIPTESFLRHLFVEPGTFSRTITLSLIKNISTTLESLIFQRPAHVPRTLASPALILCLIPPLNKTIVH
jgi:hypothetical protein